MEDPRELGEQAIADLEKALNDVKNRRVAPYEEVKRRLNLLTCKIAWTQTYPKRFKNESA